MVNQLLVQAIDELKNVKSGEIFTVKELFLGYEWNRYDKADRLKLGILFLNEVKSKELGVTVLDKTPANQQRYRKD